MVKRIHVDYFGANDFLEFNYGRAMALENMLDKAIIQYLDGQITIDFIVKGYYVGMQQCHKNASVQWYLEQFDQKCLSLDELATPLVKALMVTGMFGKKLAEKVADAPSKND